jgi:hypothetical protein
VIDSTSHPFDRGRSTDQLPFLRWFGKVLAGFDDVGVLLWSEGGYVTRNVTG